MDDTTTAIAAAPDQVGPRLKQRRTQRGVTLTAVAEATGISKSTRSRLETGHDAQAWSYCSRSRRRTACPLTTGGSPEVGDPRIRLKASRVNGRTVLPLNRQPGTTRIAPTPNRLRTGGPTLWCQDFYRGTEVVTSGEGVLDGEPSAPNRVLIRSFAPGAVQSSRPAARIYAVNHDRFDLIGQQ